MVDIYYSIREGRIFFCNYCDYRNRYAHFCSVCMQKILEDIENDKTKRYENNKVAKGFRVVDMIPVHVLKESFEEITIFGFPAIFTPLRIDRNSIPKGYYMYDVRHDDLGLDEPIQIGNFILVNYLGSVITREKLTLDSEGFLDLYQDDITYTEGKCKNMEEFMKAYPPRRVTKDRVH